ncbi:DUF4147 domain-containing protein [Neorhizobium sp. LMR1-1-1.1]
MFDAAVESASPSAAVLRNLPPKPSGRCIVIGAVKASAAMAAALNAAWPDVASKLTSFPAFRAWKWIGRRVDLRQSRRKTVSLIFRLQSESGHRRRRTSRASWRSLPASPRPRFPITRS